MNATVTLPGLLDALLAFQAEAPTLPKDAINPHFKSKYTPLDTIVEQVGPLLAKHGLTWSTLPCRDTHGDPALRYRLAHAASGQVLEDVMPLLLTKQDPQGMGSGITYARRYSMCAVLNLVTDDDDDGAVASRPAPRAVPPAPVIDPERAASIGLLIHQQLEAGLDSSKLALIFTAAGVQADKIDSKAVAGLTVTQADAIEADLKAAA